MDQTVACVIPVWNGARFIEAAIASVKSQTEPVQEIVVVDDGSTDTTQEVLAGIEGIRVVRKEHGGPAAARNLGIRVTTSTWISFLDADDLWDDRKTERQLAAIAAQPGARAAVCALQNFWEAEVEDERIALRDHAISRPTLAYSPPVLLCRRDVFEKIGYFNESTVAGDAVDWFLRARDHGIAVAVAPETLLRRRLHKNNHSRRQARVSQRAVLSAIHRSLSRKRELGPDRGA